MSSYFFPCLFIKPEFDEDVLDYGTVAFHRRRWQTSIFDLATLATKHKLHLPYQLMDVFLNHCHFEIEVRSDDDVEQAISQAEIVRCLMYLHGTSPFILPFITTHSINQYSGINSRDSESLGKNLSPGLREGITSDTATVEAWVHEPSMGCIMLPESFSLAKEQCEEVSMSLAAWRNLEEENHILRASRKALCSAPTITDLASSILHIWQGIESLFPKVNSEVTFRVSLLIAQLASVKAEPSETYKTAKDSYGDRSRAAHGSTREPDKAKWEKAWSLLTLCLTSIMARGTLPNEDELLTELLSSRKH